MAAEQISHRLLHRRRRPAGMMLGFLLARAGVRRVVLEKHADFLRDFRGDTVHPSTLRIMDELGLLDEFLQLPAPASLRADAAASAAQHGPLGDFTRPADALHVHRHDAAVGVPRFPRRRGEEAAGVRRCACGPTSTGLMRKAAAIAGVRGSTPEGDVRGPRRLTVGCDGRHSTVRAARRPAVEDVGAPIDVLWFRVCRDPATPTRRLAASRRATSSSHRSRRLLAMRLRDSARAAPRPARAGRSAFRAQVVAHRAAARRPHVGDLARWDDVKLLTVAVDRLTHWSRAGAALHRRRGACDVAGRRRRHQPGDPGRGRGRQILWQPLQAPAVTEDDLDESRRRRLPTRAIQASRSRSRTTSIVQLARARRSRCRCRCG